MIVLLLLRNLLLGSRKVWLVRAEKGSKLVRYFAKEPRFFMTSNPRVSLLFQQPAHTYLRAVLVDFVIAGIGVWYRGMVICSVLVL